MAAILVYSDHEKLAPELLTAARLLAGGKGTGIKAVAINNAALAQDLAGRGAETCLINDAAILAADTAAVASALCQAAEKLDAAIVLLSSDRRGKELAGRLAQKLGAGSLADVSGLKAEDGKVQCTRNTLGGATVAVQQIETDKAVIALAARSFEAAPQQAGGKVSELAVAATAPSVRLIETRSKASEAVDLQAAEVLVIVGQGVGKEDFPVAEKIAKILGGEIACSKPVATDKKWLPEDRIIGLSGKKCKPQLALIFGVSGQVQFTVGIRDASTVVAVNNDENAFMLQMADYAMVADAKEVLEELNRALG
ncbi:MAG: electron transfer flavoprotein subunit alpha/FixB family protein [Syntrophomonadaceae bacterium]|nr:electron transfer flavoprotein subunit alpha/FixB family protein [Syntrophomonadaceae bacterium]